MTFDAWPTNAAFLKTFRAQIAQAGGKMTDTFDDAGRRLYARAVLPGTRQVSPGDRLQGGVAMRATDRDVSLHPYVFRLVCRNGAITAQAAQSCVIVRASGETFGGSRDVLDDVRDAVHACCSDEAFAIGVNGMRSTMNADVNTMINLMPVLSRLPKQVAAQILSTFQRDADRSGFGFLNAITATARDTRDPELRWQLESLGGAVPALLRPRTRMPAASRPVAREREAALV
jgi:hypothetical protein